MIKKCVDKKREAKELMAATEVKVEDSSDNEYDLDNLNLAEEKKELRNEEVEELLKDWK